MKNLTIFKCLLNVSILLSLELILNAEEKATKESTAIFVDFDNVITTNKFNINFNNVTLLCTLLYKHPKETLLGLWHIKKLTAKGKEFSKEPNATVNTTVDRMLNYLKKEGFGDFSDSRDILVKLGTQPQPINEMIDILKQLKKERHILIGATNQPCNQNKIYSQRLKEQNIDLNKLFDAILTTAPESDINQVDIENYHKKIVMAPKKTFKPDLLYYEILQSIALQYGIDCKKSNCFFIDDVEKNIIAAQKSGLLGIHFPKPLNKQSAQQSSQKVKEELLKQKVLR